MSDCSECLALRGRLRSFRVRIQALEQEAARRDGEADRLRRYIAVLRAKLDGANRAVREQRLRADALEPGWAAKWDRRLGREAELNQERTALRAVLAPLLLSPYHPSWIDWDAHESGVQCLFCGQYPEIHEADCDVLRRDALLGRS